jgi:hypothetical protein
MKTKKAEAASPLPRIGCERCLTDGEGFAGFIYVQQPGRPMFVKPCACRIKREAAKKAMGASAS